MACARARQAILREFAQQREKHRRDMLEYSELSALTGGHAPGEGEEGVGGSQGRALSHVHAGGGALADSLRVHVRVEELKKCAERYAAIREQQVPILRRLTQRIQALRSA